MAGIFQTRPIGTGGAAGSGGVKIYGVNVPALNTVTIDTLPFVDHIAAKWLVTVVNPTSTKMQTYEVVADYLTGKAAPSYNVYGKIGDTGTDIKNSAQVVQSGGNLLLQITNYESVALTVDVLRFDLSA